MYAYVHKQREELKGKNLFGGRPFFKGLSKSKLFFSGINSYSREVFISLNIFNTTLIRFCLMFVVDCLL